MQRQEVNKPLSGIRVFLTRAEEQAAKDAEIFNKLGAETVVIPAIKTVPCCDLSLYRKAICNITQYEFVIFTSANTVKYFFDLAEQEINFNSNVKLTAVGNKTAEALEKKGYGADIIPEVFTAEGIADALKNNGIEDASVLLPQSVLAGDKLSSQLVKLGAKVDVIPLYDTVIPEKSETNVVIPDNKKESVFIFTSPSTFNNFLIMEEINNPAEYFRSYSVAVIGSVTGKAVEDAGVKVDIIPEKFNMKSLTEEIIKYYKSERRNFGTA